MMRNLTQIINSCLSSYPALVPYKLSQEIHDYFSGFYILETEDFDFDLHDFVSATKAFASPSDDVHSPLLANWFNSDLPVTFSAPTGLFDVHWGEHKLRVLMVSYGDCDKRQFIITDSAKLAHDFFEDVCRHGYASRAALLVYANGGFANDERMYEQIRKASLDDLTLSDELRQDIQENIFDFFSAEEVYNRYRLPWKRGVLLTGPPGNGKTQTIKAVMAQSKLPCISVRNFNSGQKTSAIGISEVFRRARQMAPCMLVMEDLDSLIDRNALSYLLNELDGFAENRGVLILATTNHPEKLDPALTERPSRFDRKIRFELPGPDERCAYLRSRAELHPPEMRPDELELMDLALQTEGFTFAYLKELDLSATMKFSRNPEANSFSKCLRDLIKPLKAQMKSDLKIPAPVPERD